jgi:ketosteroid isomerase-like protein
MSQENVEIVTRALDAYGRRDLELLRALNDPDVEVDWSASHGFQARVYKGFDTALDFYSEYFEAFDEIAFEIEGVTAVDDSVVVSNLARQRGRDGIEVTAHSALVFTVRDACIIRICLYQELDEALRAVGLERSS